MTDAAWIDRVAPAYVRSLEVYQPGKPIEELERELGITGAIKVASNENPLGPSPRALEAVAAVLPQLHLYPDAGGHALRRALAHSLTAALAQSAAAKGAHIAPERVALGAGSNELLYQLVLATCEPGDEVLSHEFAFLSYRLAAAVANRAFVAAPTTAALSLDVGALISRISPRTKLVIVGTPNNPTGSVVTSAELEQLRAALPARALLVVDEAYREYADAWPEIDHADGLAAAALDRRVVLLRTFSKIYGLAGLRVGYAVADPEVVDLLGRVTRTFNVGTAAQVAAQAALGDAEHLARSAQHGRFCIEELRSRLGAALGGAGVRVLPSLANFVLVDTGRPALSAYQRLLARGVIVRPMAAWGLPNHLRISAASAAELPRVIQAVIDVLSHAEP
ncbi:MAG TPA: histidinol-phosphate transaminase [Kofleriaceae bacterium]|nr:histidinol-phosphate transaminase [Kofleriaceae bacterium]